MNYKFNNQEILINKDKDDRYYITLIHKGSNNTEDYETEVSFYVDNITIPEEKAHATYSGFDYIVSTKPKNVVFNLKYDDDNSYMKTKIIPRLKQMTKEEIEKELGYKIEIVGVLNEN